MASWCIFMYVPTILRYEGGFSDAWMSGIMTAMGIFMAVWMVFFPMYYSTYKNNKIIEFGCLAGALATMMLMMNPQNMIFVVIFVLFGGLPSVMSLFFMAILSPECVETEERVAALALINGGCELLGASLGPMVAGWLSDITVLRASTLISSVCMLLSAIVAKLYSRSVSRHFVI